jgi:uncharacterized protein YgbK (DUF1537 family)
VLALVGSRSSVAREQARTLAAEPGVEGVVLDPSALLAGVEEPGRTLDAALASGRDVVATVGEAPIPLEQGPSMAAGLARLAARHAARLGGLVATGGDVARAALAALGATGLHLVGEVEAGVPLGVADAPRPLYVVTKAGAFGSPETLSRCRAALKALAR